MLKNDDTKYKRQRGKILQAYTDFILAKGVFSKAKFFDNENALTWVKKTEIFVDKYKIMQQLSLALSDLANLSKQSLLVQDVKISLLNNPEFAVLSTKKSSKKTGTKDLKFLSPEHVIKLLNMYVENPHVVVSRLVFQLFTGSRFENSIFHSTDRGEVPVEFILSQHAQQNIHEPGKACVYECIECFHTLIMESKVCKKERFYIHPKIYELTRFLMEYKSDVSLNTSNQRANKWLKENINSEFNSHAVRKTLTNLTLGTSDNRNTGRWRSTSTMTKHYLSFTTRISDLASFASKFSSF